MTITQVPLEKQLINIDLSKGMDERARPELVGNVTKIENLVCDQTGAWVKRDGTYLGPAEDASGTGTYPSAVKKILPFLNGWGCIADGGYLMHKQDSQNTFRRRQQCMELNASSARVIGSTGPSSQSAVVGMNIYAVAASDTHDAYVSGGFNSLATLTLSERATGVEYFYKLNDISFPAGFKSGVAPTVQCVFVNNRYLHVYVADTAFALQLAVFVIDTLAAIPATAASIATGSIVATLGAGTVSIQDAVGGNTYSYVLFSDGAGNSRMYQCDVTGAVTDSVTFAAEVYTGVDLNETSGDVWMIQSGAAAFYRAQASAGVSTTTHVRFASGKPGTFVSCDTVTGNVKVLYEYLATVGGGSVRSFQVFDFPSPYAAVNTVGGGYGWNVASRPFFMSTTGKHYAHMTKADSNNEISSNVICDLSTFAQYSSNSAALATPFGSFRVACQLEPNFGTQRIGTGFVSSFFKTLRYRSFDGASISTFVSIQVAQRTSGVGVVRLTVADATAFGSCHFSGSTYFAHGGLNSYDSRNLFEQGITDQPFVNNVIPGATAGNLNGSYRYFAVYRHVDANGISSYSRAVGPLSAVNVAATTGRNNLTLTQHSITNRDAGINSYPFIELYRTKSGGTQYYLCASSQLSMNVSTSPLVQQIAYDATTGLATVQDNLSDANLGSQAIMYRQPGTPNAAADRYPAPAASIMTQHKDRIFCVDPYGQRVFYSSFFVDGEAAWFNPAFNFYVHDGSGPITALASMDGRLFVFKRDQVFVVDGDGPGEAGPAGNEFSQPQALASRYGCIDHRSLVVTPGGIMYRSTRGIELLSRNLKVDWVGERVQNTVDANPYTTGCTMGPDARIYWTLATDKNNLNGLYYVPGCTVVYDTSADAWSVLRFTPWTAVYGHAFQGVASVMEPLASAAGAEVKDTIVFADGYFGIWIQDSVSSNDASNAANTFTPMTIETGWIKQGMTARQRVSDLLFLAKKRSPSNHAIKLSIAYDYSDTYTQTFTWEPGAIVSTMIEEVNIQPSTQQVLAIRLKVQDQAPADTATYPIGLGKCDALSIVAEVAPKQGSPKLAAALKA